MVSGEHENSFQGKDRTGSGLERCGSQMKRFYKLGRGGIVQNQTREKMALQLDRRSVVLEYDGRKSPLSENPNISVQLMETLSKMFWRKISGGYESKWGREENARAGERSGGNT